MAKNIAPPQVKMFSEIVNVGKEIGKHIMLKCTATGFNTSDIIVNIKRNQCVLTKEDGVNTTKIQPYGDTYWREDYVIIPQSEVSHYSCEVVNASSRFRVEKVWVPDSDEGGRTISSDFIDTSRPEVELSTDYSEVQTNVNMTCQASGFYPNSIIMNMKRNGTILTREDGVKSSGVCSNEDGTFQRIDSVEIKESEKSDFTCEVIHTESGSHEEKGCTQSVDVSHLAGGAAIISPLVGGVLVLVLVVVLFVLWRQGILGPFVRRMISRFSGAPAAEGPPEVVVDPPPGTTQSQSSLESDNSADSGVAGPQPGGSGSDSGSCSSQSGSSTSSDVPASTVPLSGSPDSGNADEAQSLLDGNDPANV